MAIDNDALDKLERFLERADYGVYLKALRDLRAAVAPPDDVMRSLRWRLIGVFHDASGSMGEDDVMAKLGRLNEHEKGAVRMHIGRLLKDGVLLKSDDGQMWLENRL
jgi:hypothetical protein